MKKFEGVLDEGKGIDGRLEAIVMRMFERCLADKRYKQAIGIAFETRRIDVLRRALLESVRYNYQVTLVKALDCGHLYIQDTFVGTQFNINMY